MRDDDYETLLLARALAGCGSVKRSYSPSHAAKGGNPSVKWIVSRKEDAQKLVTFLDLHPLHSRKKKDFEFWREAVELHAAQSRGAGTDPRIWNIKQLMQEERSYTK